MPRKALKPQAVWDWAWPWGVVLCRRDVPDDHWSEQRWGQGFQLVGEGQVLHQKLWERGHSYPRGHVGCRHWKTRECSEGGQGLWCHLGE